MNYYPLTHDFDWQRWISDETDLASIEPLLASRILFTTLLINAFEHAVLRLKNEDCVWGPVHTSVGQEAIAVAAMAALHKEDKIAGSHRAHHQFLSKALNFVLSETWNPLTEDLPDAAFKVVRRTMAEIMGLAPGYCGGRGGSMHLRYIEAGILGTNAIVGGGIPIATGAAYAEKHKQSGNVVVCFFGDGAVNQGSFHEACNLAGIWNLPIIYFIENNLYAVGTHTKDACAVTNLSLRASSYNMGGRIVEGHDVVAVYEIVKTVADGIRQGNPPCIIEAKCYRRYHHAGEKLGSAYGYHGKAEEAEWLQKDALVTFPAALVKAEMLSEHDIQRIKEMVKGTIERAVETCTITGAPRVVREVLWPKPETTSVGMRSDGKEFEGITYSEQEDFSEFQEITYSNAIAAVTGRWMEQDKTVVEFGEEVASFGGGAYGATKGLPAKYPQQVINTPISEAGFVGLTCGAAMSGMRPIVEIMFPDFSLVAADQLFNQIGKARHMYGGTTDLPFVARTRIATGCGYGGQHSMDPVGLFALFPGWRIVAPSNAFDYIGLFNTAMQSLDPVVILEHHSLYTKKFPIPKHSLDYFIPFGKAKILFQGNDVTVLGYGAMAERLRYLWKELSTLDVSAEIIDLRSLDFPSIDYETIGQSVKKTGAVAIVEEAPKSQSIGDKIAAVITEQFFDYLDAPPACLASIDVPTPVSRKLEETVLINDRDTLKILTTIATRNWC
jgi:2-oxoisovalerate dehydrogenase E1 component